MPLCDYCGEREGKFYFKTSKKWCCCEKWPSCPEMIKKAQERVIPIHEKIEFSLPHMANSFLPN